MQREDEYNRFAKWLQALSKIATVLGDESGGIGRLTVTYSSICGYNLDRAIAPPEREKNPQRRSE